MKADEFETLGDYLTHLGIKLLSFGRTMGWKRSVTYNKLYRQRSWSVEEYERGLLLLRKEQIRCPRAVMIKFATRRESD